MECGPGILLDPFSEIGPTRDFGIGDGSFKLRNHLSITDLRVLLTRQKTSPGGHMGLRTQLVNRKVKLGWQRGTKAVTPEGHEAGRPA